MNQKIIKCKSCGAELEASNAIDGVVECDYCHSKNTVVKSSTSEKAKKYLDAGEMWLNKGEFDDAYDAFLKASKEAKDEPEAYFGMAISEFQVQYLPKYDENEEIVLENVPICYKIIEDRFRDNENYKKAISCASPKQKAEYERRGIEIDSRRAEFYNLKQEGIDYDTFLCVKVTKNADERQFENETTDDAKYAHRIYNALEERGFVPFYSERNIKDRAGDKYEAHILYALMTSETMLVICSDKDYLTTPWVKNEYTRFLRLIDRGEKDDDAITIVFNGTPIENLPGRRAKLQGIDRKSFNADGRILDFVERHSPKAIEKRKKLEEQKRKEREANEKAMDEKLKLLEQKLQGGNAEGPNKATDQSLLRRANMEIESGKLEEADKLYDRVLDMVPENSVAWFGKLLCSSEVTCDAELLARIKKTTFSNYGLLFDLQKNINYVRAKQYADADISERLAAIDGAISDKLHELCRSASREGKYFYNRVISEITDRDICAEACYTKLLVSLGFNAGDELVERLENANGRDPESFNLLFNLNDRAEFADAVMKSNAQTESNLKRISNAAVERVSKLVRVLDRSNIAFYKKVTDTRSEVSLDYQYALLWLFVIDHANIVGEVLQPNTFAGKIDGMSPNFKNFEPLFDLREHVGAVLAGCKNSESKIFEYEKTSGFEEAEIKSDYEQIANSYNLIYDACNRKLNEIKAVEPDSLANEIEKNKDKMAKLNEERENYNQKLTAEQNAVTPIRDKYNKKKLKIKDVDSQTVSAGGYAMWDTYEDVPCVFVPVKGLFIGVGYVASGYGAVWEWESDLDFEGIFRCLTVILAIIASIFITAVLLPVFFVAICFAVICAFIFVIATAGYCAATVVISAAYLFEKTTRLILILRDKILYSQTRKLNKTINDYDSRIRDFENKISELKSNIDRLDQMNAHLLGNINKLKSA